MHASDYSIYMIVIIRVFGSSSNGLDSAADDQPANAVARHDNLEFLTDVVPRTMTYKAFKEKQKRGADGVALSNGQQTLSAATTVEPEGAVNGDASPDSDLMEVDQPVAESAGSADPDVDGMESE